jgi:very-short-patch-repair endonuclease
MPHRELGTGLRDNAKRLRRSLTDAERRLWYLLRGHRLEGIGFRRQVPIGPYVVDFASHRMRLVIELDGGQHAESGASKRDRTRDEFLASEGYRVLRLWNSDVLQNLDGVYSAIVAALPTAQPSEADEDAKQVAKRPFGSEESRS